MKERAKILQMTARNVKCVREVAIDMADGSIHEVRGTSGQGKTTILESIEGALRGLDPSMVRQGADKAEIELHLSNAQIKRIVQADGKRRLSVTDADGNKVQSPQAFLNAIAGDSAFRPVEWVQQGKQGGPGQKDRIRKQRDELLEKLSLKLTAEQLAEAIQEEGLADAAAELEFDDDCFSWHALRTLAHLEQAARDGQRRANKDLDMAEANLKTAPQAEGDVPDQSLDALRGMKERVTAEYLKAKVRAEDNATLRERVEKLRAEVGTEAANLPTRKEVTKTAEHYAKEAQAAEAEIAELTAKLEAVRKRLAEAEDKTNQCNSIVRRIEVHEANQADLAKLEERLNGEDNAPDLETLEEECELLGAAIKTRQAYEVRKAYQGQVKQCKAVADAMHRLVALFHDTLPNRLIRDANLPLEGLSISEDTILIDGVPIHQLGTSQQLVVGVKLAVALNPACGFVLIDGAESLGPEDRVALAEAAEELGVQLILTYVDPEAVPAPGVTVMKEGAAVNA